MTRVNGDRQADEQVEGLLWHMTRRWTPAETQRLRELAAAGLPKFKIAMILDRSSGSIEVHLRKLGIKLPRTKRAQYLSDAK